MFLKKKIRILCFVVAEGITSGFPFRFLQQSSGSDQMDAANAVLRTWGRRCTKIVYFSDSPDLRPAGVDVLPLKSRPTTGWNAFRESLIQISNSYLDNFDWFFRADLDTYVVLENLRYYLSILDNTAMHYVGHTYESWGIQYNAASAGFALSRGALHALHNSLIKGHCPAGSVRDGDVELGRCLSEVGIVPHDTRDSGGHARFLVLDPESHLVPGGIPWTSSFWSQTKYKVQDVSK